MARPRYPSDDHSQFMVRMPDGMRAEIAEAAKANSRSMNAEIVARLSGNRPSAEMQELSSALFEASNQIHDVFMREARMRISAYKRTGELADRLKSAKEGGDVRTLADDIIALLRDHSEDREGLDDMIDGVTSRMVALAKHLSPTSPIPEKF